MYLCDWKEKILWERCERCVKIETIFHVKNSSNREATLIYCRSRWELRNIELGGIFCYFCYRLKICMNSISISKYNETFGWIRLLWCDYYWFKRYFIAHFNRNIFFFSIFFLKSSCVIFNFSCYNYDSIKTLNIMTRLYSINM